MKQVVVIKSKIKLHSSFDEQALRISMVQYQKACNFVSEYIFNNNFELSQPKLNKALYHTIRNKFGLRSQMTQTSFRTVVGAYKTTRAILNNNPLRLNASTRPNRVIWKTVRRDLLWLWKPVEFKRPQLALLRGRDWSIKRDGNLSINTINGRINVTPTYRGFEKYFDGTWKFGMANVIHKKGKWYLHIMAIKEIPEYNLDQTKHVVGIDRGLRFIATIYDEKGKTLFFDGKRVLQKRRKFKRVRHQLLCKRTKSSLRRLRRIGKRENRWMTDVNHQLSKTLVNHYGPNTLFVLEDLNKMKFASEQVAKASRYEHVSWAFFQLANFMTYKAHLIGSEVIQVAAGYTSQRCPKCGRINRQNRHHNIHLYICDRCNYKSNDDRIGAMNIQLLGTRYVSGDDKPYFSKITANE